MCGIVGIYLKTKKYEKHLGKFLSGMLDGMATRGPDSAGFAIYTKENKNIFKYSICLNDLKETNFKNVAESLGAKGIRVENPNEISSAIQEAVDSNKPCVIDVVTDIYAFPPKPWLG